MQAVILAAGQGTRLRPMTADFPKCLIPINGKPIIQYQLECIEKSGIGECLIVAGFKGEKVERHFGSQFGNTKLIYIKNEYAKIMQQNQSEIVPNFHLFGGLIFSISKNFLKPILL